MVGFMEVLGGANPKRLITWTSEDKSATYAIILHAE
jgi:hypothetical protein